MILFNTLNNPSIPYCEGNDIYTRNTEYYLLIKKNYIIFPSVYDISLTTNI